VWNGAAPVVCFNQVYLLKGYSKGKKENNKSYAKVVLKYLYFFCVVFICNLVMIHEHI
jgi:hypothetical protein